MLYSPICIFLVSCIWMLLWYAMTSSTPNYCTLKTFKSYFLFYFNEVGVLSSVKWLIYINPLGLEEELPYSRLSQKIEDTLHSSVLIRFPCLKVVDLWWLKNISSTIFCFGRACDKSFKTWDTLYTLDFLYNKTYA